MADPFQRAAKGFIIDFPIKGFEPIGENLIVEHLRLEGFGGLHGDKCLRKREKYL
jgi:hypothetical protein